MSEPLSSKNQLPEPDYDTLWLRRVMSRVVAAPSGCWLWQGSVHTKGYAQLAHRGRTVRVHRKLYEIMHGVTLPPEQFVCHKCDVRNCVNPTHLWLGDPEANNRDCGNKGRHHNGVKTHCKRGHAFTPENTYLKVEAKTVMRECKECTKMRVNSPEYKAKASERQRRSRIRRRNRTQNMGAVT